jgi:hypothetical protein
MPPLEDVVQRMHPRHMAVFGKLTVVLTPMIVTEISVRGHSGSYAFALLGLALELTLVGPASSTLEPPQSDSFIRYDPQKNTDRD